MKTENRGFVCRKAARLYKWRSAAATTLLSSDETSHSTRLANYASQVAGYVLCLLSSGVAAEGTRPAYAPPPPAVSSGSIVQIIFSLLLVLAAIVLVAWLLKRMNLAQQGSGNLLKVLGGTSIGQRERIVLVEVKDTWLVVGVGPGQIRTLHTLDRPEGTAQQPNDNSSPAEKNRFAAILSNALGQLANGKRNAP